MGKWLTTLFVVVAFACLSVSAAFAGEITGNGKPLWTNTDQWGEPHTLHGNSPCAFSGQEDDQFPGTVDNPNPDYNPEAGQTQNWGHTKQATGLTGGANSVPAAEWGCNGHLYGTK